MKESHPRKSLGSMHLLHVLIAKNETQKTFQYALLFRDNRVVAEMKQSVERCVEFPFYVSCQYARDTAGRSLLHTKTSPICVILWCGVSLFAFLASMLEIQQVVYFYTLKHLQFALSCDVEFPFLRFLPVCSRYSRSSTFTHQNI